MKRWHEFWRWTNSMESGSLGTMVIFSAIIIIATAIFGFSYLVVKVLPPLVSLIIVVAISIIIFIYAYLTFDKRSYK